MSAIKFVSYRYVRNYKKTIYLRGLGHGYLTILLYFSILPFWASVSGLLHLPERIEQAQHLYQNFNSNSGIIQEFLSLLKCFMLSFDGITISLFKKNEH